MSGNTIRRCGGTNAPCLWCEDRVVGCHSTCPRYKEFNENMEKIRQQRLDLLKLNEALTEIRGKRVHYYG